MKYPYPENYTDEDKVKVEQIQARLSWIRQWAEDRNLIKGSNPKAQLGKLIEEAGEISNEFINFYSIQETKENHLDILNRIKDGIGDTVVVATIMAAQYVDIDSENNILLDPVYLHQKFEFDELFCHISEVDFENEYHGVAMFNVGLATAGTYISASLGEIAGQVSRGRSLEDGTENAQYLGQLCYWLAYLAACLDVDILECLDQAWNDIKDRKGKMIDGAFVKEEDLIKLGLA